MSDVRPREDRPALGVALMALAVLFFTAIDTSAKWLLLAGLPPIQVVFCRYAGHFLSSLAAFWPSEGRGAFRSRRPGLQIIRSTMLCSGTLLNFLALQHLPITITITIFFATPILVTLLSVPMLGETVGLRRLIAVIVGFLGVLIVIQPWGVRFHPAMLLSLGSLVCASLYFVITRMLAGIETNAVSQLWSSALPSIVLLPFALSIWVWPAGWLGWSVMIVIGLFGSAGHSAAVVAARFAEASILSPMIYLQLIFATAASLLIFSQPPTVWTMAGGLVIAGSGLYIWQRERRLRRRAQPRPI